MQKPYHVDIGLIKGKVKVSPLLKETTHDSKSSLALERLTDCCSLPARYLLNNEYS